jgi:hypothetical protein
MDHLPSHIRQLTGFGERASWSPDGTRVAFMAKSFGDAFVVDVATKTIRLLTPAPSAGYLRVQYLPNGDYFLIGARTFTDIRTTRDRDQEMWLLRAAGRTADRARPQDLGGRRHLAEVQTHRLVEHARPVSRPDPRGRVGALHGRHRRERRPADARQQGRADSRAKRPECTLEAQDFRFDDTELIYTCYRSPYGRRLRPEPEDEGDHHVQEDRQRVQRSRRHLPGRPVDAGRVEPRAVAQDSNHIDIWRMPLVPNRHRVRARDALGEYEGYKASNPCGQPRTARRFAFQSARSKESGRRRLRHLSARVQ